MKHGRQRRRPPQNRKPEARERRPAMAARPSRFVCPGCSSRVYGYRPEAVFDRCEGCGQWMCFVCASYHAATCQQTKAPIAVTTGA